MRLPWIGKAREFERLAIPHFAAVFRSARSLSDEQTADDLVQETYLRAWKYFSSFDPATNCRAWLFRILRNVWADRWRKIHLEVSLSENSAAATVEPLCQWEDELLNAEFSEAVATALGKLPPEHKWAVVLADVEEFSYQEIAEILSCPIGTVMSRISRGRRMLARLLSSPESQSPLTTLLRAGDTDG